MNHSIMRNISLLKNLSLVMLLTLISMSSYEVTKQLLHPNISIWESHIVTIIFSSFIATTSAYFVLSKSIIINQKLASEIAERKQTEEKLIETQKYVSNMINSSLDMIIAVDMDRKIVEFNKAAQERFGYSMDEISGKHIDIIYSKQEESLIVHKVLNEKGMFAGEVTNKQKNGETFTVFLSASNLIDHYGNLVGFMGVSRDISELKKLEYALELAATTDKLTAIYNRHKFEEILKFEIERTTRYKNPLSIMILDIDRFKNINDTYGHQLGDYILKSVSDIVKNNIRKADHFGRWGGDELMILSPETTQKNAFELIDKIRKIIENNLFEKIDKITISCGLTQFKDNDTIDSFIKRADDALYRAKNNGRNIAKAED